MLHQCVIQWVGNEVEVIRQTIQLALLKMSHQKIYKMVR
jgi:hypothetical protein